MQNLLSRLVADYSSTARDPVEEVQEDRVLEVDKNSVADMELEEESIHQFRQNFDPEVHLRQKPGVEFVAAFEDSEHRVASELSSEAT